MTDMPPVTVITPNLHPHGGQDRATYEVVRHLVRRGVNVTVIARRCELPPSDHLRWVRIPGPERPFLLAYPWFLLLGTIAVALHGQGLRHAAGAIVFNRLDVATVHFCHHGYSERATAERRRRRRSVPYAVNAYLSSVLSRLAERLCYRPSRVRTLVAVSDGLARELRRSFPTVASRVRFIPNGVDRDQFQPDPEARSRVRSAMGIGQQDLVGVFVGGDWERKGLSIAMLGVAASKRWHLLVAGEGDEESLSELARRHGADARLHLYGLALQPDEVYAAGDVFVFPSAYEAFALAAFEAAAAGLPLLMCRVHGAEELVHPGETGWFIDRTPESVHLALDRLAENESLRHRMGAQARAATERYTWDHVASDYTSLYRMAAAYPGPLKAGERLQ
jgi:glycosyltransferase involved in cell wall biosynthesis